MTFRLFARTLLRSLAAQIGAAAGIAQEWLGGFRGRLQADRSAALT